jgi:DNA-binding NarL/FixJ family response regulator
VALNGARAGLGPVRAGGRIIRPVVSSGQLERGRAAYEGSAWTEAFEALQAADQAALLGPDDLELLATAAYMAGRSEDYVRSLERAYKTHLDEVAPLRAVRCAFWLGVYFAQRGELGGAGGWLGRAQKLLAAQRGEQLESGYLLLPLVFRNEAAGDLEAAAAVAADAAACGERFGDPDLVALAGHERGHLLIRLGRSREGLVLLDEAMIAARGGELSPIVSGIVYCGAILACRDACELRRAREWTAALSAWCERQADLVAFTGRCLVHRAEIMQLEGSWSAALAEASRAVERCLRGENPAAAGEACYRRGEIHRLRGELRAAQDAYREASRRGREPQPGLALVRLVQGELDAAQAAIRRVREEGSGPAEAARVLPAYVEIMLAADELEAAAAACDELEALAKRHGGDALAAIASQARGAVELARGNARAALRPLRRAEELWRQLEAPYEIARVQELLGISCRELGDEDTATLELEAAQEAFDRLGAAIDLARVGTLGAIAAATETHGLTERELEVLRLVAAGRSNREIAEELVISEHTVARHVQNIFAKLGLSSRTAASAFAFAHNLV